MALQIIDPGHIYIVTNHLTGVETKLVFVKRSGGAVFYPKEWPGIQTQAVMRALIYYLGLYVTDIDANKTYPLWQLGTADPFLFTIQGLHQVCDTLHVLTDRSRYLNNILACAETEDACVWLQDAVDAINLVDDLIIKCETAQYAIRMALWCYEARAYRRKQEEVNRKQPEHDDSVRMKGWRENMCDDVPFNEVDIEIRPIGHDGHIVLEGA